MAALERGTCSACGADVALRAGGVPREHPDHRHELYGVPGAVRRGQVPTCSGTARIDGGVEYITLSEQTAAVFAAARAGADSLGVVDARQLGLDHTRLNVLMRKGLVTYADPGRWQISPRGWNVEVA